MKKINLNKGLWMGLLYGTILIAFACGSSSDKAGTNPKEEMPAELKDTTVLKMEEENALDKLKGTIDTTGSK